MASFDLLYGNGKWQPSVHNFTTHPKLRHRCCGMMYTCWKQYNRTYSQVMACSSVSKLSPLLYQVYKKSKTEHIFGWPWHTKWTHTPKCQMTLLCEPDCACSYWEVQALLVQGLCVPGHLTPQPSRRQWSQSQHTSEWLPDFWRNASVTNSIQPHPAMPLFHFQAHTHV